MHVIKSFTLTEERQNKTDENENVVLASASGFFSGSVQYYDCHIRSAVTVEPQVPLFRLIQRIFSLSATSKKLER